MKKKTKFTLALLFFSMSGLPELSNAATGGVTDFKSLVATLISDINAVIPLLYGIILIAFIIGIIRYIFSANKLEIEKARSYLIFSVVAIAVSLSIWALALVLKSFFFPQTNYNIPIPQFNTGSGASGGGTDYYNHGLPPGTPDPIGNPAPPPSIQPITGNT